MILVCKARTCTMENASNLVQRHLEWERVYHRFRVFLTITFLLRFGRAGKGDLSLAVAGWQIGRWPQMQAVGLPLSASSDVECIHKKLGTQKSSMLSPPPNIDARHIHLLCCTS